MKIDKQWEDGRGPPLGHWHEGLYHTAEGLPVTTPGPEG